MYNETKNMGSHGTRCLFAKNTTTHKKSLFMLLPPAIILFGFLNYESFANMVREFKQGRFCIVK